MKEQKEMVSSIKKLDIESLSEVNGGLLPVTSSTALPTFSSFNVISLPSYRCDGFGQLGVGNLGTVGLVFGTNVVNPSPINVYSTFL